MVIIPLFFTTCLAYIPLKTGIFEISYEEDFVQFQKDYSHVMRVYNFYADVDPASKKFNPEYEKAYADIQKLDPTIVFARVDTAAAINKSIGERVSIGSGSIPHVVLFKPNLKAVSIFPMKRKAENLIFWIKARLYNCPVVNTLEAFKKMMETDWAAAGGVLGMFAKQGKEADIFDKFVRNDQEVFNFAVTWNIDDFKELYPFVGDSGVAIIKSPVLCRPNIEPCHTVATRFTTVVALRHDVKKNHRTDIALFRPGTEDSIHQQTLITCVFFFNFDDQRDANKVRYQLKRFRKGIEDRSFEAPYTFAIGSTLKNQDYMERKLLEGATFAMLIEDQNSYYRKKNDEIVTDGTLDPEKMWEFFHEYQVLRDEFRAVWDKWDFNEGDL